MEASFDGCPGLKCHSLYHTRNLSFLNKIMFVVISYFPNIKLLSRYSSVQNCFDENIYD